MRALADHGGTHVVLRGELAAFSAYGRGYIDRAQGRYDEAMFVRQLREPLSFLGIDTPMNLVGTSVGALGYARFGDHDRGGAGDAAFAP